MIFPPFLPRSHTFFCLLYKIFIIPYFQWVGGGRFSATLLLSHLNLISFLNSFNILFLLANEQYGLKIFEHVCPPIFPYSHAFSSFLTFSTFLQFEFNGREKSVIFLRPCLVGRWESGRQKRFNVLLCVFSQG